MTAGAINAQQADRPLPTRAIDRHAFGATAALHVALAAWLLTGTVGSGATLAAPGTGSSMQMIAIASPAMGAARTAFAAPPAPPVEVAIEVPLPPELETVAALPSKTTSPAPPAPASPVGNAVGPAASLAATAGGGGDDPQAGAAPLRHGLLAAVAVVSPPIAQPRVVDPGCPALERARTLVGAGRVDLVVKVDADGHVADARVAGGGGMGELTSAMRGMVCGPPAAAPRWLTLTIDGGAALPGPGA